MANLCAGICSSLLVEKGAGYRGFVRHRLRGPPRVGWQHSRGISGSFRLEWVAGLLWNQWQLWRGTGGSFAVESVAGFTWNRWQLWRGIRSVTEEVVGLGQLGRTQGPQFNSSEFVPLM